MFHDSEARVPVPRIRENAVPEGKLPLPSLARPARGHRPQLRNDLDAWVMPKTARADLNDKVDVLDLTPRCANALANLKIQSIRQLLSVPKTRLLESPRFGPQSLAELERKVTQYLTGKWPTKLAWQNGNNRGMAGSALGPKALVDRMLSFLPERERTILATRCGLWDGNAETLASIGSRLGVSRERVRQIEARGLRRLGRVFGPFRGKALWGKKSKAVSDQKLKRPHGLQPQDGLMGAMTNNCAPHEETLAVKFLQEVWWGGKQNQH